MRYELLPLLAPGEFYQKSYRSVAWGSTPQRDRVRYFRHVANGYPPSQYSDGRRRL